MRPVDRKRRRQSIARHLDDFPRQLESLRFATDTFGDGFDLEVFATAYTSDDPRTYLPVLATERAFGRLQNYIAQLTEDGAKLAGLPVRQLKGNEPRVQPALEALRSDGAITKDLCRRLISSQKSRSLFEHDYTRVQARDVHAAVTQLLAAAGDFVDRYADWIEPHLTGAA